MAAMTPRYEGKSRAGFNWLVASFVFIALVASIGLFFHAGVSREMVLSKASKHVLTTFSALLGVVLTIGQAVKSFQKASDHKNALGTPGNPSEVETNSYNSEHLWRVGSLWTVGAIAAIVTATGEILDFYNDGLSW
jgi:hypothetical protein